MALPARKLEPEPEDVERIFRPVRGADGEVRILDLPATLENLLNLGPEDQVTQSNDHLLTLVPLFDALKRYLKRLAPHLEVFCDLQLLYKRHGYPHDVGPDVAVVEGLPEGFKVRKSLDVIEHGGRLRLVIEVVSDSPDMVKKDEVVNPDLFAQMGVEDHVLIYPAEGEAALRVAARRLGRAGSYRPNPPDGRGRIFLPTVGLWLRVDEDENALALEHRDSGERLLTSEQEEAARRVAERRVAQAHSSACETLLALLEARGFDLSDNERSRILACRDPEQLKRWTLRVLTLETMADLWDNER